MFQSSVQCGTNLSYFSLETNSKKSLSCPPTVPVRASGAKLLKTASLDHITKPSVLSSSPPECLLCRYETSWNEEKETQWPVRRKKRGKEERAREPDENWQSTVSVMSWAQPLAEPGALECQLTSCKHSSAVRLPSPQRLSLLNSCVIAGWQPRGSPVLGWSGPGGWSG